VFIDLSPHKRIVYSILYLGLIQFLSMGLGVKEIWLKEIGVERIGVKDI
jgi:hypothetical protein